MTREGHLPSHAQQQDSPFYFVLRKLELYLGGGSLQMLRIWFSAILLPQRRSHSVKASLILVLIDASLSSQSPDVYH